MCFHFLIEINFNLLVFISILFVMLKNCKFFDYNLKYASHETKNLGMFLVQVFNIIFKLKTSLKFLILLNKN